MNIKRILNHLDKLIEVLGMQALVELKEAILYLDDRVTRFEDAYLILNPSAVERPDPETVEMQLGNLLADLKAAAEQLELMEKKKGSQVELRLGDHFATAELTAEDLVKIKAALRSHGCIGTEDYTIYEAKEWGYLGWSSFGLDRCDSGGGFSNGPTRLLTMADIEG